MNLPKTQKGILSLLLKIADHGNDYDGIMTYEDEMALGEVIADIQNWLGENQPLLEKFKLEYNG